jgi:hypothetical protein
MNRPVKVEILGWHRTIHNIIRRHRQQHPAMR